MFYIIGLFLAFAVDMLVAYFLNTIMWAGIIVIPYIIIVLINIFDKEEKNGQRQDL